MTDEPYLVLTFATAAQYKAWLDERSRRWMAERVARAKRAQLRAERERDELQAEVEELRREIHSGGTSL